MRLISFTAVISALKNLQEKIRKLEVERGTAENNLKSLAAETTKYKNILQKEPKNIPGQSTVSKHTQGKVTVNITVSTVSKHSQSTVTVNVAQSVHSLKAHTKYS